MRDNFFFPYQWEEETVGGGGEGDNFTVIHCFGVNPKGENVYVKIEDFTPFGYMELDQRYSWSRQDIHSVIDQVKTSKHFKSCRPISVTYANRRKTYFADVEKNSKNEYEFKKYHYLHLTFASVVERKKFAYMCLYKGTGKSKFEISRRKNVRTRLHEYNASPLTQLCCVTGIQTAGWNRLTNNVKSIKSKYRESKFVNEYHCTWTNVKRAKQEKISHIPSLRMMSMDVEAYSSNPSRMPDPYNPDDKAFQIGCTFYKSGTPESEWDHHLITLKHVDPDKLGNNTTVHECINEKFLLKKYSELIQKYQPNVIYGYNVFGWDFEFLNLRADLRDAGREYRDQSYIKGDIGVYTEKKWGSKAISNQFFKYIKSQGVLYIDLMVLIKRDYNYKSYSLKFVADKHLGVTKDPLTPRGIFKCYENGSVEHMSIVGKYCMVDVLRTAQLFEKLDIYFGLVEMASVCAVRIDDLYFSGQQIKVHSLVYRHNTNNATITETDVYVTAADEAYRGAIVFDPDPPGLHKDVIQFDYASLYPNVMRNKNISPDTLVLDESIPDTDCNVIEWEDHVGCSHSKDKTTTKNGMVLCASRRLRFLKGLTGIYPTVITFLLDARAATRKEMKQILKDIKSGVIPEAGVSEAMARYRMLNGRQLAYKISANSIYGSLGVRQGRLPCMKVAMAVTAYARQFLKMGLYILTGNIKPGLPKGFVENNKHHGATLVYGDTDSCYVKWPDKKNKNGEPVTVPELWEYVQTVGKAMEGVFGEYMIFELEDEIYGLYLILSKKRYAWKLADLKTGVIEDKMGYKGIMLKRRDNCTATCDLYAQLLKHVFDERSFNYVSENIIKIVDGLYSGKWGVVDFVISKKIKNSDEYAKNALSDDPVKRRTQMAAKKTSSEAEYYERCLPAHVFLGEKMRRRGQIVTGGMRLPYVIVKSDTERAGFIKHSEQGVLWQKIEDPRYYSKTGLYQIDFGYYLKMVCNQIDQVMEIVYNKPNFLEKIRRSRIVKECMLAELKHAFSPHIEFD